jgi:hypothetical protein
LLVEHGIQVEAAVLVADHVAARLERREQHVRAALGNAEPPRDLRDSDAIRRHGEHLEQVEHANRGFDRARSFVHSHKRPFVSINGG